jgi:hypothetical protein
MRANALRGRILRIDGDNNGDTNSGPQGHRHWRRRLSMLDNDLVTALVRATRNDPTVTEIAVDGDIRFGNLPPHLVLAFCESLSTNFHLRTLILCNVNLGNDVLSALTDALPSNLILTHINLSNNHFTSEALSGWWWW